MRTVLKATGWVLLAILIVGVLQDPESTAGTVKDTSTTVIDAIGKAGVFLANLTE